VVLMKSKRYVVVLKKQPLDEDVIIVLFPNKMMAMVTLEDALIMNVVETK